MLSAPRSGSSLSLTVTPIALALLLHLPAPAAAQLTACDPETNAPGTWEGPWNWYTQVVPQTPGTNNPEFSHAALIPKGLHRGKVLIWRAEHEYAQGQFNEVFIFDPAAPELLSVVDADIQTNIFCSGQTWDLNGDLLVAGGPESSDPPNEYYRFYPNALGPAGTSLGPCDPFPIPGDSWFLAGTMSIKRYYPIAIALLKGAIKKLPSGNHPTGSVLVIGGAPADGFHGTDRWELLSHKLQGVSYMLESSEPYPQVTPQIPASDEVYDRPLPPPPAQQVPADRRIEYYARVFHLATTNPAFPERLKNLFLANDVEPGLVSGSSNQLAENAPGLSWIMKPRYNVQNPLSAWELHQGPNDQNYERYYAPAVLLHQGVTFAPGGLNRVLVFGGAHRRTQPDPAPPVSFIREDVQELVLPSPNADLTDGFWQDKGDTETPRFFHNAVILPTGDILLVGGACEVRADGRATKAVYFPELYHPGTPGLTDGWGEKMAVPNSVPCDPPGGLPCPPSCPAPCPCGVPYARLYHSLAVHLPDGRVLSCGGKYVLQDPGGGPPPALPDGRFSGEMFSPPYLSIQPRPQILGTSADTVGFGLTFEVTVDHHPDHPVESFVLLRPAAVTHHFDNDQRYIELELLETEAPQFGTGLAVHHLKAPSDELAPPGYYLLFAIRDVQGQGRVPSVGHFLQIR